MEAVQIQLPSELVHRLRQEVASDEELHQVIVEAVQMWLDKRHAERAQKERGLRLLREAGLVMDEPRQQALADAMMPTLRAAEALSHEQVEAALSRLKVPLSEELIAMRGER